MQKLLDSTTDDYDADRVLNLDESNENNFAIYKENVQKIEIGNGKNQIVSEDADKYVIENADETVSNLKAGDFFAGTKEDGETVIAKVKSVTKDGTTVTIVQDDTGLDEVFDYVKIDTVSGLGNAQVDDSYCEEGVVYNGLVKPKSDVETYALIDDEASAEVKESFQLEDKKIKVGKNTITLSGGVELGIKASVKLYIALSKQSIELELAYGAELTASVDGKMDDQKIQLGKITITPVPGVFINFIPKVVFKFSSNITLTGTLEGSVGLKYTNDDGIKNISKEPVFESELKIEGDFYAGLALEPEVVIISEKVEKAGVEAELGAQLHAEMTVNLIDTQSDSEKHTCKQCMNGYVYGKLKVTFSIKLFDDKKFSKEKSFDKKTEKQTFYYSITYNDFGLGKCPHVGEKVKQVCLGYDCNAVITKNGDLYMWGDNNYAQLGNASYQDVYTPEKIMENVVQVSLGERHSAAITENGDLYMWGYNYYGQLGDGSKKNSIIPKKIMENVAQVSLGQYYSAAITKNGELYLWGENASGCLGDGTRENSLEPKKIMENVAQVQCDNKEYGEFTGAITNDGDLYLWGDNQYGELGDESTEDSLEPKKIMENVAQFSIGDEFTGAVTKDGELYLWGHNDKGQLGDGTTTYRIMPRKIMSNIVQVSLGSEHSAAVTKTGELYMWGDNRFGELGDGSTTDSLKPKKIRDNVSQIVLGRYNSAAIVGEGELYVWGSVCKGDGRVGTSRLNIPTNITSNIKPSGVSKAAVYTEK